jgi:transposase
MEFAMMGYQSGFQPKLFYHRINVEQRVPQDHILRKIEKRIDFDFIYAEVKNSYGDKGNVSVPPPVILKMMLLLILYNVRSERELIKEEKREEGHSMLLLSSKKVASQIGC